jgi:hypothetical protein
MSKGNTFENELLLHLFQNADIANIGDAAGLQNSVADGSLYVALHTADPGEAGDQTTSEATYTNYARQAVSRAGAAGWTVATNQVSNTAAITFPACGVTGNTITHWSVGVAISGASKILYKGPLGTVVQGPFTAIAAGDLITIPGHTLAVDERVAFFPAFGSSLPTGITEGTIYWVKTVAGNDITISTTQGGATLDVTAAGDGVAYEAAVLVVSTGVTPSFAIGALVITED